MAIDTKEITTHIRKGLKYAIRTSFKSACDHPFVFGTVCLLLILYRCFPSLFAFLVSSSPVIICTTILLGVLLSYGEPYLPEIEEDKKNQGTSSLKVGSATNDLVVEEDKSLTAEALVDSRRNIDEGAAIESVLDEGRPTAAGKAVRNIPFKRLHDGVNERDDTFMAPSSSVEDDKKIHSKELVNGEREIGEEFFARVELSLGKQVEGALNIADDVCVVSAKDQEETNGLKVDTDEHSLDNHIDSSLDSPWQPCRSRDVSSDSESDIESSSSDDSMTDIIPMLDELHPLLDVEPQPALKSMDNSDATSEEDNESDDGSAMGAGEQQEDEHEKDDGTEEAVKWTADDQKNLMDLGTSEMERNQRLENLIAKRRARKNLRFEPERNLIDLDSNDSVPTMEDLSRFLSQIPPISASRRNPFDVPYDSEETIGLPPIPGSAPSVLLPRRNPFDIPYDHSVGLPLGSLSNQEFAPIPQRDIFFRRHESFSLGASFSGELKHEKPDSRLKPSFAADKPETSFAASKVTSALEPDMVSSEHQESEWLSPVLHDDKTVELGSQSSDSLDVDHEQSGTNVVDDDLNTSISTFETHPPADGEEEIIEVEYDSPISDANLEVIEDKYGESTSSSSSEVNEKSSILAAHEDSTVLSRDGERADENQVEDPVYDSSPSAAERRHDEDLLYAGKRLSNSSSLTSDMADISELGSPLKNISSGRDSEPVNEESAFGSSGIWVASPNLSFVDENESRSREITEIRERDVIQDGLPGVSDDFVKPVALALPRFLSRRAMNPSSLSSVDPSFQSEGDEIIESDSSLSSDLSTSSASEEGHENSGISILPSITEEEIESLKEEEEGLTGLQMIEEPGAVISDIERDLTSLERRKSSISEENDSDSTVSPINYSHDRGFTGIRLFEPAENPESEGGNSVEPAAVEIDSSVKQFHAEAEMMPLDSEPVENLATKKAEETEEAINSASSVHPQNPSELKDGPVIVEASNKCMEPEGFDGEGIPSQGGQSGETVPVDSSSGIASTSTMI